MKNYIKLFLILVAALVFSIGCSKDETGKELGEDNDNSLGGVPLEEPEKEPAYRMPLSGAGIEELAETRAISVMMNNHPKARPQSGLYKADLVFEVLAEGGVTRFLAIFHSEMPEVAGPVRSARDYYVHLAKAYNSIYVHHGWSTSAQELITSGYINSINGLYYDGSLFKRADFRAAPHNSYITYENIVKGAEENSYQLTGAPEAYTFLSDDDQISGESHGTITIDYSTNTFESQFEFDQTLGQYKRFSNGEQTADLETKNPVLLDNILVVETKHEVIDDVGRLSVDLTSGGKALLFQKGKVQEVQWEEKDGRIVPVSAGTEAGFVPGKTWVSIVPDLNIVTYLQQN